MNILHIPMNPRKNDGKAKTIGEYLSKLLCKVLIEQEGFSGKRPFGNSGWMRELYAPLIKAGAVDGSFDRDGFIDEVDDELADRLILEAVQKLFGTSFKLSSLY